MPKRFTKGSTGSSRLFERFMDEYSGRAEARRVKEAAKKKPKKRTVVETRTRLAVSDMSTRRVQALEQENAALRLQLAVQSHVTFSTNSTDSDFEQAYNRPEPEPEDVPKGRKIVLD